MRPGLSRKNVELAASVADGLPQIRIDASKIRQVLVNLVQNAAEAIGDGGGLVALRASAAPDGKGVVLVVEDDGPGIAREDLDRLFEPFFTTKFTGTGLGLTISKGLIEQHGGRLHADSAAERGATFYILLPSDGKAG